MKATFFLTVIFMVFFFAEGFSQTFSHKELYDSDFNFTEGLYLTQKDFSENHPIEKSRINTTLDPDNLTFFEQLTLQKTITIYDNIGQEITIKTSEIFGYCSSGGIYILNNGVFTRIGIIGKICHFLGSKTVANPGYWDNNLMRYVYPETSTELQQYILDIESGKILEYTAANLDTILIKDSVIHEEFSKLPRKKKNAKKYYYMRLYNEKHPLYVPVYK